MRPLRLACVISKRQTEADAGRPKLCRPSLMLEECHSSSVPKVDCMPKHREKLSASGLKICFIFYNVSIKNNLRIVNHISVDNWQSWSCISSLSSWKSSRKTGRKALRSQAKAGKDLQKTQLNAQANWDNYTTYILFNKELLLVFSAAFHPWTIWPSHKCDFQQWWMFGMTLVRKNTISYIMLK